MFKTHQSNIAQIHAVIDAFGECYFHGCGNLYDNEQDSNFRKEFTNPGHNNTTPASAYRVHFKSKAQVPSNVEDLNAMLQKSFAKEQVEASKPKSVAGIKTISVSAPVVSNVPADAAPGGEVDAASQAAEKAEAEAAEQAKAEGEASKAKKK